MADLVFGKPAEPKKVYAEFGDEVIFRDKVGVEYPLVVAVIGDALGRRQAIGMRGVDELSVLLEAAMIERLKEYEGRDEYASAEVSARFHG